MKHAKLELPQHVEQERELEKEKALAMQLPEPTGYKMLISLAAVTEVYDNGLLKSAATIQQDEVASVIGFVIKQGPDCYKDTDKFPSGPYCKEGDFILLRTYSGTRFKIRGIEFRLISDDTVEAVVLDPRGYSRC